MMLYPSIDNLLLKIDSKYSLVTVAAARARAMQAENDRGSLPTYESHKYVGKALEEVLAGQLVIAKDAE